MQDLHDLKLRIAGVDYRVEIVRCDSSMEPTLVGRALCEQGVIKLGEGVPAWAARKVLLHELIHAIDHAYLGSRLKEREVLGLEHGLWQLFKDNPELADLLFGEEDGE